MVPTFEIEVIDLQFQGTEEAIAAFLIKGPGGSVLVETGPGSTLPRLIAELEERGVRAGEIQGVLVTHIHLDHAGACGWWAQQGVPIYVHTVGAPHLIDPSKLLASATRIYGDRMQQLWGDILPAPAEQVFTVEDGQRIEVAGLRFEALETPGHASHHHVFRLHDIGFTGDALGILLPGRNWIDLPAPPPEFDLETWSKTLDRIRRQEFAKVYRTHYGASIGVTDEIDRFAETLEAAAQLVRSWLEQEAPRDEMVRRYEQIMRERATAAGLDADSARAYELANPRDMSVDGIARYWRKQARTA